ncbi:glutamate synthase subunit beta [Corynebacterium amycolatum]|uniref:glutamate synthase subunit beta n=1 Tax=Corynebacterium TaxID=1716 RepID=UPI0008A1A1CD|nr:MULTISPECIES: glutamate synthase subunit beta [Corynebacterium]KAA9267936.1 glutamate synthase subunit beta [Corynebacterium amycolatum]MBU5624902.1 glutamate synthase subunit beta [Corynebacterium amycolatum]MCG7246134.1 glutamate synthase subunit beta [Corynebacterium sp. ACRPX]MCT1718740.1 glutamate synthase subunit beta [Corynebacterium amycolatum]OFR92612.1 glutamate synthase [Corynebacterium sp. HMSC064E10]
MADPKGFMKFQREEPAHRPVPLRLMDWKEVYEEASNGQVQQQATRCMDCGVPFCHSTCPLGNIIPEWNDLVRQNRWHEAFERLHATNNFPEWTGRLCPAPCEGGCVLGINDDAVTIKSIELAIVERGFDEGWVQPIVPTFDTGQHIAVIGSGPAGLAAAQQLTRAGHDVTVFERDDKIGGLMRYGVPDYKMEQRFLDRRLEQMEIEGTEFRTNVSPTAADLAEFDAVVLATGASLARDLPVDGRDLEGIHQAMEYLPGANRVAVGELDTPPIDAKGKKVVVIGGGDTGIDCFGTALRQGAVSVTQFDIRPRAPKSRAASTPWPMYPLVWRVATAHEEGEYTITGSEPPEVTEALGLNARVTGETLGKRVFNVNTVSFHGEDGHVTGLSANEVEVIDGKRVPMEDTDFELDADLVLIALGFSGPERGGLPYELGIQFNDRGVMMRDDDYLAVRSDIEQNFDGPVFVAGDNGRGASLIVWAIAEGRACAEAVDQYLMGESNLPRAVEPEDAPIKL